MQRARQSASSAKIIVAPQPFLATFRGPVVNRGNCIEPVKAELCRRALEKVGSPNTLVNLVSQRVRQLNAGGGPLSRPLITETAGLGVADIALLEIIEDKIGYDMPELAPAAPTKGKKRRKAS
jgi:DNA-directed RNA polymerase subunit K/omega